MQRREFLGALGVGGFAAATLLTIEPDLEPALAAARVRAARAASIRIGEAFNDYSPAAYIRGWRDIEAALRAEGLGHVRMEWAFRPTGELVPFMDWHPGRESRAEWKLTLQSDEPSVRSFLTEARRAL